MQRRDKNWFREEHAEVLRLIESYIKDNETNLEDMDQHIGLANGYMRSALKRDQYHNIVKRTRDFIKYPDYLLDWAAAKTGRAVKGEAKYKLPPRSEKAYNNPFVYNINVLMPRIKA